MNRREALGTAAAAAATITLPLAAQARDNRTASPNRSGYIKTEAGVDLFVKDWGKGRPIVLTHAWPLSSDCWEQHAVALAEAGYRVISYDRRGFGRSAQPFSGYDYNVFADDLAAVIKSTGVRDVTLAGYSMGGGEIVRYLSRHGSANVAKVALVATVVPGLAKGPNNPQGVDPAFFKYVVIGGIEQWISIRGEDRANPVLLFLHGGPGDATNPWAYAVFRPWLEKFTVVQWDQRGAGRTLGRNGRSLGLTITVDRMVRDGIELSELLLEMLNQDKLILVGHSWGSRIGVLMAKSRPDLFRAYVGTGQIGADQATTDSASYDALLRKAETIGDARAIRELKEVGHPPWTDGRGFAVQHRWSNMFERADVFLPSTFALALSAPGYSLRDVNDWLEGQIFSAERLVPQEGAITTESLTGEFRVPVFVIQGAEDFTTPTSLARIFERSIRAPRKAFVTIEGGGHFAVFMKSDAFLAALVRLVYPLAKRP